MKKPTFATVLAAFMCLSSQVQSREHSNKRSEKISVVRKWNKPASVFGAYSPSKVRYHNRFRRSQTVLSSRGTGTPRDRFKNLQKMRFYGKRKIRMTATGYTHTGNRTATGQTTYRGAIAVDPNVIPLGTYIYVEDYGYGFACDTGRLIKGNRIDLLFNSRKQAINWGRRNINVWLLAAK